MLIKPPAAKTADVHLVMYVQCEAACLLTILGYGSLGFYWWLVGFIMMMAAIERGLSHYDGCDSEVTVAGHRPDDGRLMVA